MRYTSSFLAALVLVAACSEVTNTGFTTTNQARVRFVNATTDVAALTFTANGQVVAPSVPFGAPTSCLTLNPGAATFAATAAGTTNTFGPTITQTLETGTRATVMAIGSSALPQLLYFDDLSATPSAGNARLRVINAVTGAGAADVFITAPGDPLGTPDATSIGFGAATSFLDVASGPTLVRTTTAGTQNVTFTGSPFTLVSGQRSSFVIAPGTTLGTFRAFSVDAC
jgi:hypothetical protein